MIRDILPRQVNRRIGRAMHDYAMLSDGDRVLVAVSGGVDSMVLAWLLRMFRGPGNPGNPVTSRLLRSLHFTSHIMSGRSEFCAELQAKAAQ